MFLSVIFTMPVRIVDFLKPQAVYDEMKTRNIKIFGSFERCKDRLQRFYDAEMSKEKDNPPYDGPKRVHIETIPVINDEDNKVIHVAVNTVDVINIPETDAEIVIPMEFDIDSGVEYLVECYRKMLTDSFIYQHEFYGSPELRNKIKSYVQWRRSQNQFLENGFNCYKEQEEHMKQYDDLF